MAEFTLDIKDVKGSIRRHWRLVNEAATIYVAIASVNRLLIEMVICYLGVGSNLGNRRKNIKKALDYLSKTKDIKIEKSSRLYETEAQGGPRQSKFLNAAIKIKTSLTPTLLLKTLKKIERDLGRRRNVRFGPRQIDLDILLYGNKIIKKKDLIIPHPRMFAREFVLKPLREII